MFVDPFAVGGDSLKDTLGGLVVIPEPGLGGFLFEPGYFLDACIEVKDTSLVCQVAP